MSAATFFPFRVRAVETPHWTRSPREFAESFAKAKPKGLSWYAFDVEVLSETEVEFTAYDMRDLCYGGIGKEIARFKAVVSRHVTHPSIERKALDEACWRYTSEVAAREEEIIRAYADEVLASLASADERSQSQDTEERLGPKDASAVPSEETGDAQTPSSHPSTGAGQ